MSRARVVLITGARKGIGRFLVDHYLSQDCEVIGCSRGESAVAHARYSHYSFDVSDDHQAVAAVRKIVAEKGRIDVLINNAGIASMNHSIMTPTSTIERVFRTNAFGTFVLSREAAKAMVRQKYGRIVNFSTVGVPFRLEGECAYNASKAAVEMMTRIMARELGAFNITVNAVGPTPMSTDLIKGVPEEKIAALLARQGITRFASLEDVANVIDFFLSDQSSMITGQVIYLGGVS